MKKFPLLVLSLALANVLWAVKCVSFEEVLLNESLDCEAVSVDGLQTWSWDYYYGAKISGYSSGMQSANEDWLITPDFDLRGSQTVSLVFNHAINFAGDMEKEQTLWVSTDYDGDVSTATWSQLEIPTYPSGSSWAFVDNVKVSVPEEFFERHTVFAFRYISTDETAATWEIKNLRVRATCEGEVITPTALPDLGDGRLKVCGGNMLNYYYYYDESSRPDYHDEAGFNAKTSKIVDMMMMVNADIYAFCEVEAREIVLEHLADMLNITAGVDYYEAIEDGINQYSDSYDNALKSGFIYRSDKVKPYGINQAASTAQYYRNTMRIQAFEEISSGEKFTLSMNHFKAKDSSSDAGNSTRMMNVNNLLSSLSSKAFDKDILILGDLNCQVDEEPIQKLISSGYTEQLLYYDANAYSYCYVGSGSLIDHALANQSMAMQITGAGVFHLNTYRSSCGTDPGVNEYRYSDHDPYLVAMNLGSYENKNNPDEPSKPDNDALEDISIDPTSYQKILLEGNLYIIYQGAIYNSMGQRVQ
ncbi:MAG: choice-of-anchor J domain-containing protein [Paludibacteraceae bacterium]|nr:choice-of-anchor J domain-containing protein [Paludibacteraceae bacterium]